MATEFKREHRYEVIKLKHLSEAEKVKLREFLNDSGMARANVDCVVVEADWPIYEKVWDLVQNLAERDQFIDSMERRFALFNHPDVPWRGLFGQMYDCGIRETDNEFS